VGLSKHNVNDYEGALVDYGRAIELDAKHVAARIIAETYTGSSRSTRRLLPIMTQRLRADPSDVYVYRSRGWLYEQQGQRDSRARRL